MLQTALKHKWGGGNLLLYPAQPQCVIGKPCPDFVNPDPAIYNSNTPFPATTATISNDVTTFGYRVVTINICPFEYLPKNKLLYRFVQINIIINYSIGAIEYTARISQRRHEINQDFVKGLVQNPSAIVSNQKTAQQVVAVQSTISNKLIIPWQSGHFGTIPDYVIITNNDLKPSWEPFVQYKIQRGIPTVLVTVEDIYANYFGIDNPEKIRNYLKKAHDFWGAGLFVLLGGDTSVVPARIGTNEGPLLVTDMYYCDVYKQGFPDYNWNLNGNADFGWDESLDFGSDNYIGRAPVDTTSKVNKFIEKVSTYENLVDVPNKQYVNNDLFLSGYFTIPPGCSTFNHFGQDWVNSTLTSAFWSNTTNIVKRKLFDDHNLLTRQYCNPFAGDEKLNKLNTIDQLNNGNQLNGFKNHIIGHVEHGSHFDIGVSGGLNGENLFSTDVDNLSNGKSYQILYTGACDAGNFALDCFAEHFVNSPGGGGVAALANVGFGWQYNKNQMVQFFKSIYDPTLEKGYILCLTAQNTRNANASSRHIINNLTLFGEPTMVIWTKTPQNITLTVQPTLTISNTVANILPVTINALTQEATVTLYKYNTALNIVEVYASQTIATGGTTVSFTVNPDTVGVLKVMVTAHNYLPATANVNVLFPQAHLYISGYNVTDTAGNSINFITQGQTVNLSINLTNPGSVAISSISALLNSNPLFANIISSTVTYPIINPGQTVTLTGFSFTSLSNNLLSNFLEMLLNISAAGGYLHQDNLFIDLKNPVLERGVRTMTNPSNVVINSFVLNQNGNLTVAIKNIGTIGSGPLQATLTTGLASTIVNITTPTSTYANIGSFLEQVNASPFVFKFIAPHTGAKPFTITLTNTALSKTWTFNFDLNEGLPPLITNFRFTSTKLEIKTMWDPIANIGGYNVYRSNTIGGTYVKKNNFLLTSSAFFTDLDVAPAMSYYYKISVVSLSGNELPLAQVITNTGLQGYLAYTSLDFHTSFPREASSLSLNGFTSTTIYDVDNASGDHHKEIFYNCQEGSQNGGKILGFRDSGQELFDIDSNTTSISGFANTTMAMRPNSAVGDVDNDGRAEVFSISRHEGNSTGTQGGRLYAYKTTDNTADSFNRPDKLWASDFVDLNHRAWRNPVLYDVDSNGFLDIIVADEKGTISVFDKDKNMLPGWPQNIVSADYSHGHIAVADLDHDGKAEIALGLRAVNGTRGAIFIFNHDGTPFTVNPFKEFANDERADSGIVFADIDNDLNLDILINTKNGNNGTISKVYAFKQDGTPVLPKWNGINTFAISSDFPVIPRIAVGDLNNDGNLEIAYGGTNSLYILDRFGNNRAGFPVPNVLITDDAPILADIDGGNDIEIVINNGGKLTAYKNTGVAAGGFPLESSNGSLFVGTPSIDDLDNNGTSEIVISTMNGAVYAYNTDGNSSKIEWGSYRNGPHNTGTYKEVCNNVLDLMVRDDIYDIGKQPNNQSNQFWQSPDFWIRNLPDGIEDRQNPEYGPTPNYAYVRVTNKSCLPTTGSEKIELFWAKASTSLEWPDSFDGLHYFPAPAPTGTLRGNRLGIVNIPPTLPGHTSVVEIPFIVPNPADYAYAGTDQRHFCFITRIVAAADPNNETNDIGFNIVYNNNITLNNVSIIDNAPNVTNNSTINNGAIVAVGNPFNEPRVFNLELIKENVETGQPIYDAAEVSIKMDQTLFNAWVRGNKSELQLDNTPDEKKLIVKGNNALLNNIMFNAKEIGTLDLKINFLTEQLTNKNKFVYHIIQKDALTNKIIGGETYEIKKKSRQPFIADAGGDKIVDKFDPITISAAAINKPAVYNWYDTNGNLIATGKDLQIANAVAEKYKLEVVSTVDGFKDYSEMEVKLDPNRLKTVAPNPVTDNTKITYNLNQVNSAYLMVMSYYMSGGVSNNYVLDVNTTETNINFSNYAHGFYKVVLVTNGVVSGMKIVFKD